MLRASKALIWALAADVSLASSQTGAVVNMVDSIGSLLQAHKGNQNSAVLSQVMSNLRLVASATPGQADSMRTALTTVIGQMTDNVLDKITKGFDGTEAAVVASIENLQEATETAVTFKNYANTADQSYWDCVDQEKTERSAVEDALTEETRLSEIQSGKSNFEGHITLSEFVCDISTHSNCLQQLTNYETAVTDAVEVLEDDLTAKKGEYGAAKTESDAAKTAHSSAISSWQETHDKCVGEHATRRTSMCSFGEKLQQKCERHSEYETLITQVLGSGTGHSQSDRDAEWQTTELTICMLKVVRDGGVINDDALSQCGLEATSDRIVEQKTTQFDSLMTVDNFSCDEKTIQFTGFQWTLPAGDDMASDDYKSEDYVAGVSLDETVVPFDFCEVGPTDKR